MLQDPRENSTSGPSTVQPVGKLPGALKHLIKRHPYLSTLGIFIYFQLFFLALHFFASPLIKNLHLSFLQSSLLGEVLLALAVAVPLIVLNWWSETGFTRGITWRGVVVCIMPVILIAGPSLLGLTLITSPVTLSMVLTAALLVLCVGFVEEGLCRGLLVRSLLPRGIWTSVLLSSVLFAGMHLFNLLSGFPLGYVLGQVLLAFGSGILFATVRLRTRSIWPSLLMHAAHDFPGILLLALKPTLALSTPWQAALTVNGVFCVFFILNAIVLLRPKQLQKLRVTYGLASEPVTPLPGQMPPYYQLPPYPYPNGAPSYPPQTPYGYANGPQAYPPAPSEYVELPTTWPQAYPPPPSAYMGQPQSDGQQQPPTQP